MNHSQLKRWTLCLCSAFLALACIGSVWVAKVAENYIGSAMLGTFSIMCLISASGVKN